jgi:hypothetical protein
LIGAFETTQLGDVPVTASRTMSVLLGELSVATVPLASSHRQ